MHVIFCVLQVLIYIFNVCRRTNSVLASTVHQVYLCANIRVPLLKLKVAHENICGQYVAILRTLSKRAVVLQGDENIVGRLQLENKAGLTTQPEFNISEYLCFIFINFHTGCCLRGNQLVSMKQTTPREI